MASGECFILNSLIIERKNYVSISNQLFIIQKLLNMVSEKLIEVSVWGAFSAGLLFLIYDMELKMDMKFQSRPGNFTQLII